MVGRQILLLAFIAVLTSGWIQAADDAATKEIVAQLKEEGVRISSTTAFLASESEFSKALRDVTKLRRLAVTAEKRYSDFKRAVNNLDAQIVKLNQQSTQLNIELANVSDVVTNNRLIGAINAIDGRLRLAYQKKENLKKLESDVHGEVSKTRDAVISHIIQMRKTTDKINGRYSKNERVTYGLIRKYNMLKGVNIKLEPSKGYLANLRKLERFEDGILSENIPLRRERNTYWASVTIGDEVTEMVVDSGASIVLLPYEDAIKLGIKPGKNDPEIRMVVADGRTISGYKMTIKSMRLGKFTAKNVECAVLGAEATNAEPLLGMSFLGNFKFELDAGKSTLKMTQLGGDSGSSTSRPSTPRPTVTKIGEPRDRTIFPSEFVTQIPDMKFGNIAVNGEFRIVENQLVSTSGQTTAMQVSDVVSDFDLKLLGELDGKGMIYFLFGWDQNSQSGYLLYHNRYVNFGQWRLSEYQDGHIMRAEQSFPDSKLGRGTLNIVVKGSDLSVLFHNKAIFSDFKLASYHPGMVIMGTRPGRYPGKRIVLKSIEITETPETFSEFPTIQTPSAESFAKAKLQDLLASGSVAAPEILPTIGSSGDKPVKATHAMELTAGFVKSVSKKNTIIEIDKNADDFEITIVGNMEMKGYVFWLVGWDNNKSTGYRIEQEQLVKNDAWRVRRIADGLNGAYTNIGSKRLGRKSTATLRVLNKVLSIEVDGKIVVPKFVLDDYQPGSIMLGTNPNRYGGRTIQIDSVTLRKL